MDKSIFELLINDNSCIKINTIGGQFFKDNKNRIIIQFIFCHSGLDQELNNLPTKRISIEVIPIAEFINETPTIPLNESIKILANADFYEYALVYEILVNSNSRRIEVKLIEEPVSGKKLITKEEKDGIFLSF